MSSNQLICVKRPEPGLSAIFEDMYLNERLVDVTLSCCDGQLQAHKLVLAASSPYFSGLFDKLANPFHYPVIIIKDMRIEDLRLMVEFMYRGQLTITQERLTALIKSAENLQITGLSSVNESTSLINNNIEPKDSARNCNGTSNTNSASRTNQKLKRAKKSTSSNFNQAIFGRIYPSTNRQDDIDSRLSSHPDKLLEQSMVTGESIDDSHPHHSQHHNSQYSYNNNDSTSTRNLNNQLHTPSPSSLHVQHLSNIDQQHQQQQLSDQLQVLSHSLAANRSSLAQATSHSHQGGQVMAQQHHQSRGRVHPCNICWKTFREKANLKRHLQVHSLDRVVYACPDCNKTFSWKDNYIRHTKTAHHINNARPQ